MSRHRRALVVAAAVVAAAAVFVLVWFQPQKLWIDDTVVESEPAAPDRARAPDLKPAAPITPAAPSAPVEVMRGALVSRDHHTSGTVRVLDVGGGRLVVRIEGLDTSNGPDLYVYLTATRAGGPEGAFDDDFVNLGRLKGNKGDQNYDVPAATPISRYPAVVIWCDRFNAAFGAADLSAA